MNTVAGGGGDGNSENIKDGSNIDSNGTFRTTINNTPSSEQTRKNSINLTDNNTLKYCLLLTLQSIMGHAVYYYWIHWQHQRKQRQARNICTDGKIIVNTKNSLLPIQLLYKCGNFLLGSLALFPTSQLRSSGGESNKNNDDSDSSSSNNSSVPDVESTDSDTASSTEQDQEQQKQKQRQVNLKVKRKRRQWQHQSQSLLQKVDEENEEDDENKGEDTDFLPEGVPRALTLSTPTMIDTINIDTSLPSIADANAADTNAPMILTPGAITIAYATTTGTCSKFASDLYNALQETLKSNVVDGTSVNMRNVYDLDWWDEILNEGIDDDDNDTMEVLNKESIPKQNLPPPVIIFVLPTWTDGTLPPQIFPSRNNNKTIKEEEEDIQADTGEELTTPGLLEALSEISNDWRVAPKPLRRRKRPRNAGRNSNKTVDATPRIACFGMGSSAYDNGTYCKPAKDTFVKFVGLGAASLLRKDIKKKGSNEGGNVGGSGISAVVGMGDDESGDCTQVFQDWMERVVGRLSEEDMYGCGKVKGSMAKGIKVKKGRQQQSKIDKVKDEDGGGCGCGKDEETDGGGCCQSTAASDPYAEDEEGGGGCCSSPPDDEFKNDHGKNKNDNDDVDNDDETYDSTDDSDDETTGSEPSVMDLEDMGSAMHDQEEPSSSKSTKKKEPLEMITPKQAKELRKEGYRLIGTHSAVKLCRWTKHQLRGRGGCYKHTFYGITSYQCMEATPSLACANKCVFCWRHHKNPVGREWRWKTDDPGMIVDQAVIEHVNMIKETKGIPGIKMDRWREAHTVRHCALSLVGEPIMYPRINEFLGYLHDRKISTYLVTNGQHPDAIEALRPVTQLYVSVDAPTPKSLDEIDRPLFKDAWDRLRRSLKCLGSKGCHQRTVARLTVVKGWNSDEIGGYARLVALGRCSLIEIKGVTFCGKSDASNLNMSNSPWHHEVVALARNLLDELEKLRLDDPTLPSYGLACEHVHSVSILLARKDQFYVPANAITGEPEKWRTWIDYDKFNELAAKHAKDPLNFTFDVGDYVADMPEWAAFGAEGGGFDPTDMRHRRKGKHPKYTRFDSEGVPTHDDCGSKVGDDEREKMKGLMRKKREEIGGGGTMGDGGSVSVVTTLRGGERTVDDASLMFRGLTVVK